MYKYISQLLAESNINEQIRRQNLTCLILPIFSQVLFIDALISSQSRTPKKKKKSSGVFTSRDLAQRKPFPSIMRIGRRLDNRRVRYVSKVTHDLRNR